MKGGPGGEAPGWLVQQLHDVEDPGSSHLSALLPAALALTVGGCHCSGNRGGTRFCTHTTGEREKVFPPLSLTGPS